MASLSIDVSDDMIKKMKMFPNIQWEDFIANLISEYLNDLTRMDELVANSEFTIKDADELGERVKKSAWIALKEKYELT